MGVKGRPVPSRSVLPTSKLCGSVSRATPVSVCVTSTDDGTSRPSASFTVPSR
jgi:hypothetical protein